MADYKHRVSDSILAEKLNGMGAVLVEGTKWCGKTTTALQQAKSVLYMDNPKDRKMNIELASVDPEKLLKGKVPRLIDEWQLAPELWDAVRYLVDRRGEEGQFILTGSSVPLNANDSSVIAHSGIGRIARLRMRPMSLWESGESNGQVSLKALFKTPNYAVEGFSELTIDDIAFLICRGGWPKATLQGKTVSLGRAFDYYDVLVNSDIQRVDGVVRNPARVERLLKSLARYQGCQASLAAICDDIKANDNSTFDDRTVFNYITALKKMFVVEDVSAWNPNLRSRTSIRSSDTRYFVDPSIAVAALGLGPDELIANLSAMGLLFETLCIRDLRVFADAIGGNVFHYRDKTGLECDAVIHLRNGSYGLIEIKLGGDRLVEEGAKTLLTLASKIDTDKMKQPSFLMVLTATGQYAFRRKDGVCIVPVGCLGA